jgi:predicted DNA-binding protein (UPF0251 family)
MPRKKCCRKLGLLPGTRVYRPEGPVNLHEEEVLLSLDEFEAIRLADFSGLYQEEAAMKMGVSRQTFGRIIESARGKIADMLINGKTLRIDGGQVSLEEPLRCGCGRCNSSVECSHRFREDDCPKRMNET